MLVTGEVWEIGVKLVTDLLSLIWGWLLYSLILQFSCRMTTHCQYIF